ncbi:MAG: hypothetical protein L0Y56_17225 [Nitrospira sp.]|nr:hypothetical protein [Nitrospira sp.]
MALGFTEVERARSTSGRYRTRVYDVQLDSSYPTGGWPITPNNVGMLVIYGIRIIGNATTTGVAATTAFLAQFDFKTSKLQLFEVGAVVATPFAEEANATSHATEVIRIEVIGR